MNMGVPHIVLAAESLAPGQGGICRVARLMARTLAAEAANGRLRAQAVAFRDQTPDPGLGLPVIACGGSRLRFVLRVRRALWRSTHALYDFAGMGRTHEALRPSRVPLVCWMHGIEVWDPVRPDYLAVLRRAALLLVNSRYTRDRAAALNPELARATICWLATEEDDAPPPPLCAPGPIALIVGRIDSGLRPEWPRYKGHDALVRAWPEVVRRVPGARLLVVGDGPGRPELEELVRFSPARGLIELRGFVPERELAACYASARLFAMPSRGEGFGLVYAEAMRHGLPVVASRQDAGPEVNLNGETGYNVDLDQPGQLVARVAELLSDPGLAARMGAAGRRRWAGHFRYSAFGPRFLEAVEPWWRAREVAPARKGAHARF